MATCKFCGKTIDWVKEGRKNVPIEQDGMPHECQEAKNARKSTKTINPNSLSSEEIAKYENAINNRVSSKNKK